MTNSSSPEYPSNIGWRSEATCLGSTAVTETGENLLSKLELLDLTSALTREDLAEHLFFGLQAEASDRVKEHEDAIAGGDKIAQWYIEYTHTNAASFLSKTEDIPTQIEDTGLLPN